MCRIKSTARRQQTDAASSSSSEGDISLGADHGEASAQGTGKEDGDFEKP
jgi:hypothetical protein